MSTINPTDAALIRQLHDDMYEVEQAVGSLLTIVEFIHGNVHTRKAQNELFQYEAYKRSLTKHIKDVEATLQTFPDTPAWQLVKRYQTIARMHLSTAQTLMDEIDDYIRSYDFIGEKLDLLTGSTDRRMTYRQILAVMEERTKYKPEPVVLLAALPYMEPDRFPYSFEYQLDFRDEKEEISYRVKFHTYFPLLCTAGIPTFKQMLDTEYKHYMSKAEIITEE